jgi:2,3-bisphosphoglycerate-dependent phosphoglycerate mutase
MHPRFDDLYKDLKEEDYKDMPRGESLKMVRERVTPYWEDVIKPTLSSVEGGKSVLFVAHEHVLRGMVQTLSGMDNDSMMGLRLPNAAPFVFELDKNDIDKLEGLKNYYI